MSSSPTTTTTRPRTRRAALRAAALNLPDDLWIEILGFVGAQDAASMGRALCAAKWMAPYAPHAWRSAVVARWPAAAAVASAAGPVPCWRKLYEMLALRQAEADAAAAVTAAAAARGGARAASVTPVHRAVLVEWLAEVRVLAQMAGPGRCTGFSRLDGGWEQGRARPHAARERARRWGARAVAGRAAKRREATADTLPPPQVSWDWGCESTVLFRAVTYLEAFMVAVGVEHLGVYQVRRRKGKTGRPRANGRCGFFGGPPPLATHPAALLPSSSPTCHAWLMRHVSGGEGEEQGGAWPRIGGPQRTKRAARSCFGGNPRDLLQLAATGPSLRLRCVRERLLKPKQGRDGRQGRVCVPGRVSEALGIKATAYAQRARPLVFSRACVDWW